MVNFVCEACGYRFEKEKEIELCPYCGEKGAVKKEKTANELLEDTSNPKE